MIENTSQEPLIIKVDRKNGSSDESRNDASMDVKTLLGEMTNERYAMVIRRLILEEETPEEVAMKMGVTVDNLYNIKKRAMKALTQIALELRS